jgi:hypothetical protein
MARPWLTRHAARVQGGSSFNALMRAMKQQVIDTKTGERDPNLLFEIDRMSMNRVQVFPDGELDVQARSSAPHSAAFVRPRHGRRVASGGRPHGDVPVERASGVGCPCCC